MAKRKTEGNVRNRPQAAARGLVWLYGTHAVAAALRNPDRRIRRVLAGPDSLNEIKAMAPPGTSVAEADRAGFERVLPRGAVHQGIAAEVEPLPQLTIEDAVEWADGRRDALLVVLDQVTDPQNVGAVLRNAAAFGAAAVIVPENGSPEAGGALAKAAAGALETMPLIRVVNLKRALETLKGAGFWCLGLAGEATKDLAAHDMRGRTVLVLGAEGDGMRRLTRETCDLLVRIPILPDMESLNVSAAAAVSLYEWRRQTAG